MRYEGGFQGRTGKLVDSCYSWWCGSIALQRPILEQWLHHPHIVQVSQQWDALSSADGDLNARLPFNSLALQKYIFLCCQSETGGLLDKPGKPADHYHTCYSLSGLSLAQRPLQAQWSMLTALESDTMPLAQDCAMYVFFFQWFMPVSLIFSLSLSEFLHMMLSIARSISWSVVASTHSFAHYLGSQNTVDPIYNLTPQATRACFDYWKSA